MKNSHPLSLSVQRYCCDRDGVIIDNNFNYPIPFFLFGTYEKENGFRNALGGFNKLTYVCTFTNGKENSVQSFMNFPSIAGGITEQTYLGDIVHVYTDKLYNFDYFYFIVQRAEVGAGAILNFFETQTATSKSVVMLSDNPVQLREFFYLLNNKPFNILKYDNVNPGGIAITPKTFQTDFLKLHFNFKIDRYSTIINYIHPKTNFLQLDFDFEF